MVQRDMIGKTSPTLKGNQCVTQGCLRIQRLHNMMTMNIFKEENVENKEKNILCLGTDLKTPFDSILNQLF